MTLFPKEQVGQLLAIAWLSAWAAVTVFGLIIRGVDGLVFFLTMGLTFPFGYIAAVMAFYVLKAAFVAPSVTPLMAHAAVWLFIGLAGYAQWFIAIPWGAKHWQRHLTRRSRSLPSVAGRANSGAPFS